MDKQILAEKLKVVLATAYSFQLKAHNYHWNVVGPHFSEYHNFFGDIYERVHDDVDDYAEQIRVLGAYSPGSLSRFTELTRITDELAIPEPASMFSKLSNDNKILIDLLSNLHSNAEEANEIGLSAILEDKIVYHTKLGWMLKAFNG